MSVERYVWRGKTLEVYHSKTGDYVVGNFDGERVLKKDQRGCRGFLRSEISGLSKAIGRGEARIHFVERKR